MKVYNETLAVQLNGLKLDCLSQPDFTKTSVNFRAEAGDLILYLYWINMNGIEGITFTLGLGIGEREFEAKSYAEAVVGFTPDDKVYDFMTAMRALKVTVPADYQVLV